MTGLRAENFVYRTNEMFQEAKKRGLLTEQEIQLIKERQIKIGMSEGALIASWGSPRKKNRTVNQYGVREQYVYGTLNKYSKPTYVYLENGKVVSWQD